MKCRHGYEVDKNGNHIIPKSTAELIAEAKKLLRTPETIPVKTKQQKEFQATIQKWKEYLQKNEGKISRDIPKTIFDKDEK